MWSYVGSKENKRWIWLAIDATTREIVGAYIGDRSRQSAKQLWLSLPPVRASMCNLLHRFLVSI
jgi:IS1 family transposase